MTIRNRVTAAAVGAWLALALTVEALSQEAPQQERGAAEEQVQPKQILVPDSATLRSIFDEAIRRIADEKAAGEAAEKRKESREESDLEAQQEMAKWACWLVTLTAIQIIVGAVTLWFLVLTFRANRVMAEAAKTSADAIVKLERAYVFVDGPGMDFQDMMRELMNRPSVGFAFRYQLNNAGKTPAVFKDISCITNILTEMNEPHYHNTLDRETVVASGGLDRARRVAGSRELARDDLQRIAAGEVYLWCWGRVVYEDVFGEEHVTAWWVRYNGHFDRVEAYGGKKWNYRS